MDFESKTKCTLGGNKYVFTRSILNSKGQLTEYFRCGYEKCKATLHVRPVVKQWKLSVQHTFRECYEAHKEVVQLHFRRGTTESWNSFAVVPTNSSGLSSIVEEEAESVIDSSAESCGSPNEAWVSVSSDSETSQESLELEHTLVSVGGSDESTMSSSQTGSGKSSDESSIVSGLNVGIAHSGEFGSIEVSHFSEANAARSLDLDLLDPDSLYAFNALSLSNRELERGLPRESIVMQVRPPGSNQRVISPIGSPVGQSEFLTPAPKKYTSTPTLEYERRHGAYVGTCGGGGMFQHCSGRQTSGSASGFSSRPSSSERHQHNQQGSGYGATFGAPSTAPNRSSGNHPSHGMRPAMPAREQENRRNGYNGATAGDVMTLRHAGCQSSGSAPSSSSRSSTGEGRQDSQRRPGFVQNFNLGAPSNSTGGRHISHGSHPSMPPIGHQYLSQNGGASAGSVNHKDRSDGQPSRSGSHSSSKSATEGRRREVRHVPAVDETSALDGGPSASSSSRSSNETSHSSGSSWSTVSESSEELDMAALRERKRKHVSHSSSSSTRSGGNAFQVRNQVELHCNGRTRGYFSGSSSGNEAASRTVTRNYFD